MNYKVSEKDGKRYIECVYEGTPLRQEQDALDLIAECMGNDTKLLLLHDGVLPEDFFRLKTGLAGSVLQKFINYRVKAAAVVADEQKLKGRFKEMVAETNKGNAFRVFNNASEAEKWLLGS